VSIDYEVTGRIDPAWGEFDPVALPSDHPRLFDPRTIYRVGGRTYRVSSPNPNTPPKVCPSGVGWYEVVKRKEEKLSLYRKWRDGHGRRCCSFIGAVEEYCPSKLELWMGKHLPDGQTL
jgi:hypothetical protein